VIGFENGKLFLGVAGDGEKGQFQASQAQAEIVLSYYPLITAFCSQSSDELIESGVCVRRTVCDLQAVILEFCGYCEGKPKVFSLLIVATKANFFRKRIVFSVRNILSILLPSYVVVLKLFHRKYIRLHASRVEGLSFLKITDIEPIALPWLHFAGFEVKPLQMPFGIGIHPHKEVVFELIHLKSGIQVSALETRIKDEGLLLQSWVHSHEKSVSHDDSLLV
jgi:hypothetical protein